MSAAIQGTKSAIRINGYTSRQDYINQKTTSIASITLENKTAITTNEVKDLLDKLQPTTSATIAGANVTTTYIRDDGDPTAVSLKAADIFQEDFSDTTAVPTLVMNFINSNDGKKKSLSFKYMGNPYTTDDFDTKALTLARNLATLIGSDYDFLNAALSLNGKDTIVAGE